MLVRAYLITAPDWVRALYMGVIFGAAVTVAPGSGAYGSWTARIVMGVIEGAVFGVAMAWFTKRDFGPVRSELADLPLDQRKAALRAAVRGPAPVQPATRTAALHYVERTRELTKRRWWFGIIVYGLTLVLAAVLALTATPWWWFGFALFAAFLGRLLVSPRRIRQRIAVLYEMPVARA